MELLILYHMRCRQILEIQNFIRSSWNKKSGRCCDCWKQKVWKQVLGSTWSVRKLGVPNVIAKAKINRHATVLKKIGVDTIIFRRKKMESVWQRILCQPVLQDWIALSPAYSIVETQCLS